MHFRSFVLAVIVLGAYGWGQSTPDIYYSVPPIDAPELAPRGSYSVGVRTIELKNPGQVDILNFDKATGKAPLYDRPLTVEVWYPATIPDGKQERTSYEMALPGNDAKTISVAGKALRDARRSKENPFRWWWYRMAIRDHGISLPI